MFKLSKRSYHRLKNVEPLLIAIIHEAIKTSPYDFNITEDGGFRTAAYQNLLFKKGVSQCDGYNKISRHQTGRAVDIFVDEDKNKIKIKLVAHHIKECALNLFNINLIWGGDWNNNGIPVYDDPAETFYDPYHFEIKIQDL